MTQIMLVRHGQANSGARDEESYDRLSELGHRQAAWLGEYLMETGETFTRVYSGSMRRHLETAEGLGAERFGTVQIDPRLNEFPYFSLAQAHERQTGEPVPTDREGFARQLKTVLSAWANDRLEGVPERFGDFHKRVTDALGEISAGEGPALIVTSGGLISTVLRETLDLNDEAWSQMCLAIMNTSFHRLHNFMGQQMLTQFNNVAHLETAERRYAQTHL